MKDRKLITKFQFDPNSHGHRFLSGKTVSVIRVITYRAKLLNADWFRQRAFFLNFPSMEGKITRS